MGLLVLIESPVPNGYQLGAVLFVHGKTVSVTGGTPFQIELQERAKWALKKSDKGSEMDIARRVLGQTGYCRLTDVEDTAENRAKVESLYPKALES
ncbi:MAG: hypothetical protein ABJC62_13130 [Frankiaceae bacterium]